MFLKIIIAKNRKQKQYFAFWKRPGGTESNKYSSRKHKQSVWAVLIAEKNIAINL